MHHKIHKPWEGGENLIYRFATLYLKYCVFYKYKTCEEAGKDGLYTLKKQQ